MSVDEDTRWLEWVTKQFETIAGEDKEIDLDEFKAALKVKEVSPDDLCAKNCCEIRKPFGTQVIRLIRSTGCSVVSALFIFYIYRRCTASVL